MESLTRKRIKNLAERIAIEAGFTELPIDPRVIADKKNIMIKPKPSTEVGCSGMLIRSGENFGIMYATHIDNIGFQNFSIAHELGHYFIDGHAHAVTKKTGCHFSQAELGRDSYEKEADVFASALLMPEDPFKKEIPVSGEGLDAIKKIAEKAKTSLTATAFRYAELSEQSIASILSEGNKVIAYSYSDKFRCISNETLPNLWGKNVPQKTLTSSYFSDPTKISNSSCETTEIDAGAWLGVGYGTMCTETSLGLGAYNRVLTILSCGIRIEDNLDTYDSAEDEESLIEQWTPRFKRR